MDTAQPQESTAPSGHTIYSVEQAIRHLTQLRPEAEQRLYVITDEVLFNRWDAFCLSFNQEHRDEYLPYLPHVFDLLKSTTDGQDIFDYLLFIEENVIGTLPGDTLSARRAANTVDLLLKHRDTILNTDQELF
jgi:hypothetical protein